MFSFSPLQIDEAMKAAGLVSMFIEGTGLPISWENDLTFHLCLKWLLDLIFPFPTSTKCLGNWLSEQKSLLHLTKCDVKWNETLPENVHSRGTMPSKEGKYIVPGYQLCSCSSKHQISTVSTSIFSFLIMCFLECYVLPLFSLEWHSSHKVPAKIHKAEALIFPLKLKTDLFT